MYVRKKVMESVDMSWLTSAHLESHSAHAVGRDDDPRRNWPHDGATVGTTVGATLGTTVGTTVRTIVGATVASK